MSRADKISLVQIGGVPWTIFKVWLSPMDIFAQNVPAAAEIALTYSGFYQFFTVMLNNLLCLGFYLMSQGFV